MPRLSDSMEEGTILRWMKSPGDEVSLGEELVEIETDKANMVYEAPAAGTLVETLAQEGDTLPIGQVIARVGEAGEKPSGDGAAAKREPEPAAEAAPTTAPRPPRRRRRRPLPSGDAERGREGQGLPAGATHREREGARPGSALRLGAGRPDRQGGRRAGGGSRACAGGGSGCACGACGRATSGRARRADPRGARAPGDGQGRRTHEDLTKLQQTVARRMAESKATAPHFYLSAEMDMSRAVAARARIKAAAAEGEVVPSFNDMVVKACAIALREHPAPTAPIATGGWSFTRGSTSGVAVAGAGRAGRADGVRRRPKGPAPDRLGDAGARRSGSATARSPRPSSRAGRSPSRTWGCTASRTSTPSSTRRRPGSSPSARSPSRRWFATARSPPLT